MGAWFGLAVPIAREKQKQSVVEADGGEVVFVRLRCSDDELEKRMTDPGRKAFGKLNSLTQYRDLTEAGVFIHPEVPDDRLVLDTTYLSAPAAAARIGDELGLSSQNR